MSLRSIINIPGAGGLVKSGALAGVGLVSLLALWDGVGHSAHRFGIFTGAVGVLTGGLLLLLALKLSWLSYWLSTRGFATALRRRLLMTAIFCGGAGMTVGCAATTIWVVAGAPLPG